MHTFYQIIWILNIYSLVVVAIVGASVLFAAIVGASVLGSATECASVVVGAS